MKISLELLDVAKDRCEIEEELVSEGKLPAERLTPSELFFTPEWNEEDERSFVMTRRLVKKCKDLIQFNVESSNNTQQEVAIKEYIKTLKIYMNLLFIRDVKCDSNNQMAVRAAQELDIKDLDAYRIQSKVFRAKLERVEQIYGSKPLFEQRSQFQLSLVQECP